jgi:hypothetical protein
MSDPETGVEVIVHGPTYALGEGEDYYGVWREDDPEGSLVRFPKTEEGFERAEGYFARLNRRSLLEMLAVTLLALMVGGLLVWVVGGGILIVKQHGGFFSDTQASLFTRNVEIAEAISFRVWIGSLLVLIALGAVRYLETPSDG